eukprot:Gb_28692 [translate_table: standard]
MELFPVSNLFSRSSRFHSESSSLSCSHSSSKFKVVKLFFIISCFFAICIRSRLNCIRVMVGAVLHQIASLVTPFSRDIACKHQRIPSAASVQQHRQNKNSSQKMSSPGSFIPFSKPKSQTQKFCQTRPDLSLACKAFEMSDDEEGQSQQSEYEEKEHFLPMVNPGRGVPVFVMLPLDSMSVDNTVNRRQAMNASLLALKSAGVEGVMMDVWWGLVEKDFPGQYNWSGYRDLIEMVRKHGLKIQAVMSFHRCGGNVGDSCFIPLPKWVLEEMDRDKDLAYTDRWGRRNYEYISLGCDNIPVLKGRTPVQCYTDYMKSFQQNFRDLLGETIVEIQVGMGPAGELRYPSYPESDGTWRFPGIGAFQCYDKYMLGSLRATAERAGQKEWAYGGPHDAGHYNNWPEDTGFFRTDGSWNSPYGQTFLEWYSGMLLDHGERILIAARGIFGGTGAKLSGKVAGIHWHYGTKSHAPELTAGYYNTRFRDGYLPIARMFGRQGVIFNFTCIEMKDFEQPQDAKCSPEKLISQVIVATRKAGVPLAGENALPRYDKSAHIQIISNSNLRLQEDLYDAQIEHMCAFTYLRMSPQLFQADNWRLFVPSVRKMRQGKQSHSWEEKRDTQFFLHSTRPLMQ